MGAHADAPTATESRVVVPLDAAVDGGAALERRVQHGVYDGVAVVGWSEILLTE